MSMTRVLATKPEVIAAIRKRLLASDGPAASDDVEVAIFYFGDVQDHILKLQQPLVHYERMLSESHPMFLRSLRVDWLRAKAKGGYSAIIFSLVAVVVNPPFLLADALSMNVTQLNNMDSGKYTIFFLVIVAILCIQTLFLLLVRYWWVKAGRRRGAVLQ